MVEEHKRLSEDHPVRSKGLGELPERRRKQVREQAIKLISPRYSYLDKMDDEAVNRTLEGIVSIAARVIPTSILMRLTAEQLASLIDAIAEVAQTSVARGFQLMRTVERDRASKAEEETKSEPVTEEQPTS